MAAVSIESLVTHTRAFELSALETELFELLLRAAAAADPGGDPYILRVAGGWVRDKILGRPSHDIDIALNKGSGLDFANAVNAQLEAEGKETHDIGEIKANPEQSKHLATATVKVLDLWIDFVNLRSETYTEDSRIPEAQIGTPLEDALRRDLTINSLFYNINTNEVEDYTGKGLEDLQNQIIRTPLDPEVTFMDDPLRMLRTVRFAARYGFQLAENVGPALSNYEVRMALMEKVSRERVGIELAGMMKDLEPGYAIALIDHHGFLDAITNEANYNTDEEVGLLALEPEVRPYEKMMLVSALIRERTAGGSTAGASGDDSSEGPDFRRLALTGAMLYDFMGREAPVSSKPNAKLVPVSYLIVKEEIKWSKNDAEGVTTLQSGAIAFQEAAAEIEASGSVDRATLGRILRTTKTGWEYALDLAAAIAAPFVSQTTPATERYLAPGGGSLNVSDMGAAVVPYNRLRELVATYNLEGVWDMEPLLKGKDIMDLLDVKGKAVGEAVTQAIDWQLAHPEGDKDALAAHLLSIYQNA